MTTFIGRFSERQKLTEQLDAMRVGGTQPGRCVVVSGPPNVGKSRLVSECLERARIPTLYFSAALEAPDRQLAAFATAAGTSDLRQASRFRDIISSDWETALRLLSDVSSTEQPRIVVIDNATVIAERDPSFIPALWGAWDGLLAQQPILLILIARDPSALRPPSDTPAARKNAPLGTPNIHNPTPVDLASDDSASDSVINLALDVFTPADIATVLNLDPVTAFDAYLVTGGHPQICAQWPIGADAITAIGEMLARSLSAFEVAAELSLSRAPGIGEQPRAVLSALAGSESSRSVIATRATMPPASLDRALRQLISDSFVSVDKALSSKPSREARYRIADPYLRFWTTFIAPHLDELARGRSDLVHARIEQDWLAWRDPSIKILIRHAMDRLARRGELPGTRSVGGYWTRFDAVHLDLVGTDTAAGPGTITFVGSITWNRVEPFDHLHLGKLVSTRASLPGTTDATPMVAVSASGSTVGDAVAAILGPTELMSAWDA